MANLEFMESVEEGEISSDENASYSNKKSRISAISEKWRDHSARDFSNSSDEVFNRIFDAPKIARVEETSLSVQPKSIAARFRAKNPWSDVINEQLVDTELRGSMGLVTMNSKILVQRGVESYSRSTDSRKIPVLSIHAPAPDETTLSQHSNLFDTPYDSDDSELRRFYPQSRKRKLSAVNKKSTKVSKNVNLQKTVKRKTPKRINDVPPPMVTEESSVAEVAEYISFHLQESKKHMLENIIRMIGIAAALQFLARTLEIERTGGMNVLDESRRRTPGGVFLQLLRTSPDVDQNEFKSVLSLSNKQWKKQNIRDATLQADVTDIEIEQMEDNGRL